MSQIDLYEAAWNRSALTPAGSAPSAPLSLRDLGSKTHFIPVSSDKSYKTSDERGGPETMVMRGRADARIRAYPPSQNCPLMVCGTISSSFARYSLQLCIEARFSDLLQLQDGIRQALCMVVDAGVRGRRSGPFSELSSDRRSRQCVGKKWTSISVCLVILNRNTHIT